MVAIASSSRALLPGGIADVERDPNRADLVDAGSGTVDLALARASGTTPETARRLAERPEPAVDPWVLALLGARFGTTSPHASRARIAAAEALRAHLDG